MAESRFKSWREDLETFAVEVIYEKRHGHRASALRVVLHTLSWVFSALVQTRIFLYQKRIFLDRSLS